MHICLNVILYSSMMRGIRIVLMGFYMKCTIRIVLLWSLQDRV